jgi:hypothetical protein
MFRLVVSAHICYRAYDRKEEDDCKTCMGRLGYYSFREIKVSSLGWRRIEGSQKLNQE